MIDNGRDTIVIIDASQMSKSLIEVARRTQETASEGYQDWRFRIMDRILFYIQEFSPKEVIIAQDSSPYWRKDIFRHYKAFRKVSRQKDAKTRDDWYDDNEYYKIMDEYFEKIQKSFPFKFLKVDKAEADDIAGVLSSYDKLKECNKVLVTTDQDFLQLQRFQNVYLYNPQRREFMISENPKEELLMKICQGDVGDSIPSMYNTEKYKEPFLDYCINELDISKNRKGVSIILDDDEDKFFEVSLKFQLKYGIKASTSRKYPKKKCQDLISTHTLNDFLSEEGNEEIKKRFKRNYKLIDLTAQPKQLKLDIIDAYENTPVVKKTKLYEFVLKHKLNNIADNITIHQEGLKRLIK